jgi:predicted porin
MLLAKYTNGPLKLYAGYEHIRFMAPSDPQTVFTDISGDLLCINCQAFNNTTITNTAFGVNGLGDKILQIVWTGAKYAVTDQLDVIAAYYQYIQNSFFGTAARGPAPCSGAEHPQCAGTFYAISAAVDWKFAPKWDLYAGFMFSQVKADWRTTFSSATTSILRSGCASASESWLRPICGLCFGQRR